MTTQFGRYEVTGELGRGAMGVVYRATDPVLGRTVAIKTINLAIDADERAEYEARFNQEAKAAGSLNHPAIVTIYDLGRTENVAYMAMEFIDGIELKDMLGSSQPLPAGQAIAIGAQVADGLSYAHQRGVVHRDIKPANIMVLADGSAKITDFGIARIQVSDVKTRTGVLLGSPKYMAPEQILGQGIDHRADIFALGIVLYEMLTGKAPFAGNSLESLMYQTTNVMPPPPSTIDPALPEMLDLIVARALAKRPEDRYQDARELATDLRECDRLYGAGFPKTPRAADGVLRNAAESDEDLASTRGLSTSFDSFEATQKLAHAIGMDREFDDYAATVRITRKDLGKSQPAIPLAGTSAGRTVPPPANPAPADAPPAPQSAATKGGPAKTRETEIAVLIVVAAILAAAAIVFL